MTSSHDAIILGAGAAGLMCAAQAGQRGLKVLVLERSKTPGQKIIISGGGRCNFTNLHTRPENYFSENPDFVRSALSRFTPQDMIALVEKYKIAYHEKKLGQLFCDGRATQMVDLLLSECRAGKVELQYDVEVQEVRRTERFVVATQKGEFSAPSLVVATGGLSFPKLGATDFGYRVAKQFGLRIVPTSAALDGFVFAPQDLKKFEKLAGVSTDALVRCGKQAFRENILFTHVGLSGPAALGASLYWNAGDPVEVNLLPHLNVIEWLIKTKKESPKASIQNAFEGVLSKRLAEMFLSDEFERHQILGEIADVRLRKLGERLERWKFFPVSTVGYSKAEVTRGGVDTRELSSKTMESNKVPGLFFIGEVIDVTGWLGGFNFQWAWASGYAAGQSLSLLSLKMGM